MEIILFKADVTGEADIMKKYLNKNYEKECELGQTAK